MIEYLKSFNLIKPFIAASGDQVLGPVYGALDLLGPYVLSIVLVLSIFYGIFLGVKYAKAETADAKANMQKTLINFVIGAAIIWVLLAVLYAVRAPLGRLIDGY